MSSLGVADILSGGWGTSALRPVDTDGVISMKIIRRTSRTSISGVILGDAFCCELPPNAIDIGCWSSADWTLAPNKKSPQAELDYLGD